MKGLCPVAISDPSPPHLLLSRGWAREPTHLSRQQDEGGIEQDQVEVDHDLQVSL